jgi:hypothetical protein
MLWDRGKLVAKLVIQDRDSGSRRDRDFHDNSMTKIAR